MKKKQKREGKKEIRKSTYISLAEAALVSPYSQEYLSLRARQEKLRAVKLGRNWFTTFDWLGEYVDKTREVTSEIYGRKREKKDHLKSLERFIEKRQRGTIPQNLPFAPDFAVASDIALAVKSRLTKHRFLKRDALRYLILSGHEFVKACVRVFFVAILLGVLGTYSYQAILVLFGKSSYVLAVTEKFADNSLAQLLSAHSSLRERAVTIHVPIDPLVSGAREITVRLAHHISGTQAQVGERVSRIVFSLQNLRHKGIERLVQVTDHLDYAREKLKTQGERLVDLTEFLTGEATQKISSVVTFIGNPLSTVLTSGRIFITNESTLISHVGQEIYARGNLLGRFAERGIAYGLAHATLISHQWSFSLRKEIHSIAQTTWKGRVFLGYNVRAVRFVQERIRGATPVVRLDVLRSSLTRGFDRTQRAVASATMLILRAGGTMVASVYDFLPRR